MKKSIKHILLFLLAAWCLQYSSSTVMDTLVLDAVDGKKG